MLDHVFTDAIGALRSTLERALLEPQSFEERFQADVLLGDLSWQTSYGLPGEGTPPRIRADITFGWPTWAQSAYRSWYIGEPLLESPRIEIELVVRVQRLAESPDMAGLLGRLDEESPAIGADPLVRTAPTLEHVFSGELTTVEFAVEVSYEGVYELDEATLADGTSMDAHFGALGGWIAASLVAVGDLPLRFVGP